MRYYSRQLRVIWTDNQNSRGDDKGPRWKFNSSGRPEMQADYIGHLANIQGGKCSLPWCGCNLKDNSVGGAKNGFVSVQRLLVRDHVDLGDNLPVFEAFPSP